MRCFKRGGLWTVLIQCQGEREYIRDTDRDACIKKALQRREEKKQKREDKRLDYYWLYVSLDKYELPIYVAETIEELAQWQGVQVKSIIQSVSRYEHGAKNGPYRRVRKEAE